MNTWDNCMGWNHHFNCPFTPTSGSNLPHFLSPYKLYQECTGGAVCTNSVPKSSLDMKANMIIQSAQQQMDLQGRIPWRWYLQAYIKTVTCKWKTESRRWASEVHWPPGKNWCWYKRGPVRVRLSTPMWATSLSIIVSCLPTDSQVAWWSVDNNTRDQ
jgi:hypothetical protein